MRIREREYYSIRHDAEVVQVSTNDAHGREYFCIIPSVTGESLRERRHAAVYALQRAIDEKALPGEIPIKEHPTWDS